MKKLLLIAFAIAFANTNAIANSNDIDTHRQYLSGTGCDDMVQWDFMCSDGMNSGKWTKIGVPSCWELQGFGTFQYGMKFYGKPNPEGIANEVGKYKYEFTLPEEWVGRQILLTFEASMTDTYVEINGRKAGSKHMGGFYRFQYDVSDRVFFGKKKNRIEVTVNKESENTQVNMAERRADYWNFGGIIRPVFVISKPATNIDRVAINAGMDGRFIADCFFNRAIDGAKVRTDIVDEKGKTIATNTTESRSTDIAKIDFKVNSPKLWSAETPYIYKAVFTLIDAKGATLHREEQKFGFRTIEYRTSDGVYINGNKVIFKGVNRHSFRPESGRTLSKAKNIEDVELIKSMNMNAVRLSHYPADPEFLDACDSLGVYVECELSGWHWAHDAINGQKLVKSMVTRDENHPSIIFWSNGNEGGFNYELEPEYARWDIQKRVVIYPWENRNGFETKHYRSWGETQEFMRKPEIFMPTEFLHGLYDGGHGAGLKDYWDMMMANPRCAGGFLWDLADEGVKRVDMDGFIDNVGNYGADGIVGPHHEKEGSYFTIKEVWSPVQISHTQASGKDILSIDNCYNFLNLNTCKFSYKFLQMPKVGETTVKTLKSGTFAAPDAAPGVKDVKVEIPTMDAADALSVTATDTHGKEIFTWTWKLKRPQIAVNNAQISTSEDEKTLVVSSCGRTYTFSKDNGRLVDVKVGGKTISLSNGPRFIAIKRADRSMDQFYNHDDKFAEKKKTFYTEYPDLGTFDGFKVEGNKLTANYRLGSFDKAEWTFCEDGNVALDYTYNFGGVVDMMGVEFDYPETSMKAKSWVGNGPYRVWQNRMQGPQYGFWQTDYNDPIPGESFEYPEFKGYFANTDWMKFTTTEGNISISNADDSNFIGVYSPRDGRDHILYTLPQTGICILKVIPAVRNKVNCTDLNGPSAQPFWAKNETFSGRVILKFE
ncbi:MAG: glycoside hydrolase family 2 TIM barrel-domain containing protein [Prevotellaceae bacterium]|nr:glycoside hydrolase family 2 TIM barrel-domain containing protein [Prevotellaceae bacterium]